MPRTFTDAREWTAEGTALLADAADRFSADDYAAPSVLPGWTRKHVIAHVAANADAIGNLVHWAATGEPTPMYSSPGARVADIERGAQRSAGELGDWLHRSAEELGKAMAGLTDEQWRTEVRTAQGRIVPATETVWMRAREVCVHAVDLDVGLGFADLPAGFNAALREDIRAKRAMTELPAALADAPQAELTAWLAGRPHALRDAPELGPWF